MIMIGDDTALKLLAERLVDYEKPVVFLGINNNPRSYFSNSRIPVNFTGVLEHLPVFPWIRYIKKILPESKNGLVLLDNSPTSEAIINTSFRSETALVFEGLSIEYKIAQDWDNWKGFIQFSSDYDFIVMPTFHNVKDNGKHVDNKKVIHWTSENSTIPVFAHQDYAVGDNDVVGAYVIYGTTHGAQAAEIVKRILKDGKRPGEISPILDSEGQFYFNKKQLQRFKIDLPDKIKLNTIYK